MRKVMVFGTFDIFHKGHRSFLKQAKRCGDYLMVVVARDKTVKKTKKQDTRNKEQVRLRKIGDSKLANKVILGSLSDKYQVIKKHKPGIICLGYDQRFFVRGLEKRLRSYGLKTTIIRLKPYKPEVYKSSKLELFNKRIENKRR